MAVRAGNKLRYQTDVMRGVWGESDLLEEQQLKQRRRTLERPETVRRNDG